MHHRINVTLPEDTLKRIDQAVSNGNRSRFIDTAVRHYLDSLSRHRLKNELKEGAQAHAVRDLQLSHDWFGIEEEIWHEGTQ